MAHKHLPVSSTNRPIHLAPARPIWPPVSPRWVLFFFSLSLFIPYLLPPPDPQPALLIVSGPQGECIIRAKVSRTPTQTNTQIDPGVVYSSAAAPMTQPKGNNGAL